MASLFAGFRVRTGVRGNKMKRLARTLVLLSPVLAVLGCGERPVSYSADVKPFVDQYCLGCHGADGPGSESSGLRMDSYEALMQGTKYGPVVKPGDSFTSALVMRVEGRKAHAGGARQGDSLDRPGREQQLTGSAFGKRCRRPSLGRVNAPTGGF